MTQPFPFAEPRPPLESQDVFSTSPYGWSGHTPGGRIALGLRLRAVRLLPIDYDEDDYLGAAQRYAQFIAAGDVRGIVDYAYLYEHPPLVKWVDALAILPLPPAALLPERPSTDPPVSKLPQPHIRVVRTVSAAFGTLEVVALAILNPLAGLFLAAHT